MRTHILHSQDSTLANSSILFLRVDAGKKSNASFVVHPSWISTRPLVSLLRATGYTAVSHKGGFPAAFTRTFTALLSAAAYRQPLSVSSGAEDRAPIEGKMQMLQW